MAVQATRAQLNEAAKKWLEAAKGQIHGAGVKNRRARKSLEEYEFQEALVAVEIAKARLDIAGTYLSCLEDVQDDRSRVETNVRWSRMVEETHELEEEVKARLYQEWADRI